MSLIKRVYRWPTSSGLCRTNPASSRRAKSMNSHALVSCVPTASRVFLLVLSWLTVDVSSRLLTAPFWSPCHSVF
ncbi:unnamed protein product [Protopolystoma xenopodis]|uniref:Uncharacterized protein n=1 Tax=Protopolystoma xenopodis TaxID=117903 RepID=A0A448WDD5_9PLAT|nr:unnamed protein product [Protopolystoma xenopodis]